MSELDPKNTVVTVARVNNAKLGAIYFDYVVPIFVSDIPRELFPPGFESWEPASNIETLTKTQKQLGANRIVVKLPDGRRLYLVDDDGVPDLDALELVSELSFLESTKLQAKLYEVMNKAKIGHSPIIISGKNLMTTEPAQNLSDVTITMSNMPLVDVEGASWEQIIELRRDSEARKRLRLYLAKEYIGQSKEQIEAGIAIDIENYKASANKHGFSLLTGILEATVDAKMLLGPAGGSVLFGSLYGPNMVTTGAAIGLRARAKIT